MKKIVGLILAFVLILTLNSCFAIEDEFVVSKEYSNDYFSLNYPREWEKEVKGSGINKFIIWQEEGLDFQFIIDVREITDSEVKENHWQETFKIAEKFKSMNIIDLGQVEIDGEIGEKLELEVKIPDGKIENLYYQLEKIRNSYEEIDQYLKGVGSVSDFIKEIKNEATKLDEIEAILPSINNNNYYIDKEELLTFAVVEGVKYELESSKEGRFKEKYIVVNKEEVKFRMVFSGNKVEYDNKIEAVQQVLDTIKLVD
ncbi:hypothetical protein [Halonatronum saccharophilum]|uniref:hypothetical protein n=1 Tax=Halonatronum saccharophilum TaxID=150060 RepID=UPI00047F2898|nr:hypothetical protein [Halonatronum saccharophilum]